MKKLLLFLFIISIGTAQAQNYQDLIQSKTQNLKTQINALNFRAGDYKFCSETKSPNDLNILEITDKSTINIKTSGKNVSINFESIEFDDGDTTKSKTEMYSSHRDDGNLELAFDNPDSMLIYIQDSAKQYILYAKIISSFLGDKVSLKETFIDVGVLFGENPTGLLLFKKEYYNYQGSKLTYISSGSIDFSSGLFGKSDSTTFVYENNNLVEKTVYYYSKETSDYVPQSRDIYSYDDKGNQIYEEFQNHYGASWVAQNRTNNTFDSKNRNIFSLSEVTYNGGTDWLNNYRDSTFYDNPPLYLGFYNKQTSETWNGNNNWRLTDVTTYTDCGSTPDNTLNIETLDFDARFLNHSIIIDNNQNYDNQVSIQLIDLQGRVLFKRQFKHLPDRIATSGLTDGVYILNIVSKNKIGSKKLIKN